MTRIAPMDLSFLLLERANRPFHMAAMTIFQKPEGQQSSFGPRLFDAYRHSQAVKPFTYKFNGSARYVAAWKPSSRTWAVTSATLPYRHRVPCSIFRRTISSSIPACSTGDTALGVYIMTVSRTTGSPMP